MSGRYRLQNNIRPRAVTFRAALLFPTKSVSCEFVSGKPLKGASNHEGVATLTRITALRLLAAAALWSGPLPAQQTRIDLGTQSKNIDFTSQAYTKPFKTGTALPATCSTGEAFFRTDTAGLYGCTAPNTWQPLGGGGGGTGNMQVTSGVGAPAGACTAGASWYQDTSTTPRGLWYCSSSGVWRKVVDSSGSGPFTLTGLNAPAPSPPPSGSGTAWFDSTDKVWKSKDDTGAIATTVRPAACPAHGGFLNSVGSSGAAACSGDIGTSVYHRWEFLSNSTSGTDFEGWTVATGGGGTAVWTASPAGHPGVVRIQTDTGASSDVFLLSKTGQFSANPVNPAETFETYFIFRLNGTQPDSNQLVRIGLFGDQSAQPSSGIYLEKLAGDTSWFGVARSASVQTRSGALAAVTNGWVVGAIRRVNATTIGFRIAATVAGLASAAEQTVTENIPAVTLAPVLHMSNSSGAARSLDVDAVDISITGIAR